MPILDDYSTDMVVLGERIGRALSGKPIIGYVVEEANGVLRAYIGHDHVTHVYPIHVDEEGHRIGKYITDKRIVSALMRKHDIITFEGLKRVTRQMETEGRLKLRQISRDTYRLLVDEARRLGIELPSVESYL